LNNFDHKNVLIRAATMEDLPTLLELEQAVVEAERPFNNAIKAEDAIYYDINSLINDSNALMAVIEYQGQIIATGYSQIRASKVSLSHTQHGYLGFMYVSPDYRGQGLNKRLIDHLIKWTTQQGINDLYLDVYSNNAAAIKAYEKVGFTQSMVEMKLSLD